MNTFVHIYYNQAYFEKNQIIIKQAPHHFFYEKCIKGDNYIEINPILVENLELKIEVWKDFQRKNNKINPPFSKHKTPIYCGGGYTSFPGKGIKFTGDFLDSEL